MCIFQHKYYKQANKQYTDVGGGGGLLYISYIVASWIIKVIFYTYCLNYSPSCLWHVKHLSGMGLNLGPRQCAHTITESGLRPYLQGCYQPIMAQAKKVFLGDTGLWWWLALVQKYPESLAGTQTAKWYNMFSSHFILSLSLQVRCAVVCQLFLQIFPSPSSFLSHNSFPLKKSFEFNPFLAAVSQEDLDN